MISQPSWPRWGGRLGSVQPGSLETIHDRQRPCVPGRAKTRSGAARSPISHLGLSKCRRVIPMSRAVHAKKRRGRWGRDDVTAPVALSCLCPNGDCNASHKTCWGGGAGNQGMHSQRSIRQPIVARSLRSRRWPPLPRQLLTAIRPLVLNGRTGDDGLTGSRWSSFEKDTIPQKRRFGRGGAAVVLSTLRPPSPLRVRPGRTDRATAYIPALLVSTLGWVFRRHTAQSFAVVVAS